MPTNRETFLARLERIEASLATLVSKQDETSEGKMMQAIEQLRAEFREALKQATPQERKTVPESHSELFDTLGPAEDETLDEFVWGRADDEDEGDDA